MWLFWAQVVRVLAWLAANARPRVQTPVPPDKKKKSKEIFLNIFHSKIKVIAPKHHPSSPFLKVLHSLSSNISKAKNS
jgi:hypothetical protein